MIDRFMIGQYGYFDVDKYKRDFRKGFFGIEACSFESENDMKKLVSLGEDDGFKIGIHFPLRSKQWSHRDPQYMSLDSCIRRQSFKYISDELEYIKDLKLEYVLLHYPKPVVLDESIDWHNWRFSDSSEYMYDSQITFSEFEKLTRDFFIFINDIAEKSNISIILELDAINKYIYETDLLETLLCKYPRIKLCLDLGRLHLQDMSDMNFDSFYIVEKYAKYASVIHVWNVKIESNKLQSHYPALPSLSIDEGWADIKKYVSLINKENKNCKYLFEHNSSLISDDELDKCYEWIQEILNM